MTRNEPEFTLAAAGDAIITRKLSSLDDNQFIALRDQIRGADASFVNLEILLHNYEGYPAAESGGTYMRAPGWAADELADTGFDIFAAANNHTGDYSHGGMEATMRELESRDLPYAGLGQNLSDARSPAYVDTSGGRVGVVAACSTFVPGSQAGEQRPDMQGRPGLSPLGLKTRYVVPENAYEQIEELAKNLGLEAIKNRRGQQGFPVPGEKDDGFTFLNVEGDHLTFEVGDKYKVKQQAKEDDAEAIHHQVQAAASQSDWVVSSLHAHEGVGGDKNDNTVPEFLESFARECIDSGADIFVGHGPHVLRGIEIYNGAPLFYSLGNFMMQNETVTRLPAEIYDRYDLDVHKARPTELFDERVFDQDGERKGFLSDRAFWETVMPICEFNEGGLERIKLYPLELGFEESRSGRGYPRLANGEAANRILNRLTDLSEPYGTEIEIEDNRGVIPLNS